MRWVAVLAAVVAIGGLVTALLVTAWALLAVPPAVVVGVAAWKGISPLTVLRVAADRDDPGSGPSGMLP